MATHVKFPYSYNTLSGEYIQLILSNFVLHEHITFRLPMIYLRYKIFKKEEGDECNDTEKVLEPFFITIRRRSDESVRLEFSCQAVRLVKTIITIGIKERMI